MCKKLTPLHKTHPLSVFFPRTLHLPTYKHPNNTMGSIFSALSRLHLRPRYPLLTLSPPRADTPPTGAARLATGTLPADPAVGPRVSEGECVCVCACVMWGGQRRERGDRDHHPPPGRPLIAESATENPNHPRTTHPPHTTPPHTLAQAWPPPCGTRTPPAPRAPEGGAWRAPPAGRGRRGHRRRQLGRPVGLFRDFRPLGQACGGVGRPRRGGGTEASRGEVLKRHCFDVRANADQPHYTPPSPPTQVPFFVSSLRTNAKLMHWHDDYAPPTAGRASGAARAARTAPS